MFKNRTTTASKRAADIAVTLVPTTTFRYMFFIAQNHKRLAILTVVFLTVWELLLVSYPLIVQRMVDALNAAEAKEVQVLIIGGISLLVLMCAVYIFARSSMLIVTRFAGEMVKTAAAHQMSYLARHSHGYFQNRFAGSINGKVSSASDGLQGFIFQLSFDVYSRIITIVSGVVLMSFVSVWFALIFTVSVLAVTLVDIVMVKKRRPINKAYSKANTDYRGYGVDILTNVSAVRQFARQEQELQKLEISLQDRRDKFVKQAQAAQQIVMINNIFSLAMIAASLALLVYLFSVNSVTVGQIVLVILLLQNVNRNMNGIGNMISNIGRLHTDIQHGLEDIYIQHEIVDDIAAGKLVVTESKIDWQAVTFSYGEITALDNFNLTIEPGQRIGLVGPSGAGKTTFVSLLLRQHDLDSGAIMIDGQDISKVTQDSLREQIAVVPQEPLLFHRSIRDNIAYGKPDATDAEIIEVAHKAQAHDFISTLEKGYDTEVGERGVKLSGGQKQRVAIARAMLKDAPILVLDEATSALDSESEVAIQKALHELMIGKTVVAIAHRLSTLREMDRIIVMEEGRVIEDGNHETLAKAGGTYQRLWEHQAGGFLTE